LCNVLVFCGKRVARNSLGTSVCYWLGVDSIEVLALALLYECDAFVGHEANESAIEFEWRVDSELLAFFGHEFGFVQLVSSARSSVLSV
jgi:hypothetical protein